MCTACGSYDKEIRITWHEALTPEQRSAIAEGQDVFICVVLKMDRDCITQTSNMVFNVRPPESSLIGGGYAFPSGGQTIIDNNPEGAFACLVEAARVNV